MIDEQNDTAMLAGRAIGTPQIASLARSLSLLEAILGDQQGRCITALADNMALSRATAHRYVTTLAAEGFLLRLPGRRFAPGPRLLALLKLVDEKHVIVAAAAPVLHRLAVKLKCVVHLGTLEDDMVTYRIKTGSDTDNVFTRVGLQIEAYCTAIGKVLLAHLPDADCKAYLTAGPFPALTGRTITEPAHLLQELTHIISQGFARDDEEIAEGLACIAVPIVMPDGRVMAAISVSRAVSPGEGPKAADLEPLRQAARQIEAAIEHGFSTALR